MLENAAFDGSVFRSRSVIAAVLPFTCLHERNFIVRYFFLALTIVVLPFTRANTCEAQTTVVEFANTSAFNAKFIAEYDSLRFEVKTRTSLPFVDVHLDLSVGTSGFLVAMRSQAEDYIYRSMKKENGEYPDSPSTGAPNGNQKGCRIPESVQGNPNPVHDIDPDNDNNVGPEITGDDGLSVFNKPIDPKGTGHTVGRIKVSDLPEGLGLSDPDSNGHQHIKPTTEMTFEEFQDLLNDLPWEDAPNNGGSGSGGAGGQTGQSAP